MRENCVCAPVCICRVLELRSARRDGAPQLTREPLDGALSTFIDWPPYPQSFKPTTPTASEGSLHHKGGIHALASTPPIGGRSVSRQLFAARTRSRCRREQSGGPFPQQRLEAQYEQAGRLPHRKG